MAKDDDKKSDATATPAPFDIETYWTAIQGRWVKQDVATKLTVSASPTEGKFKRDLARGQAAEHDFFMKYQHCITRTDGRRGDFEVNKTSEVLELKSDSYNPNHTDNFFMERWSSKGKNGGVWQAAEHGCHYYIYSFPLTGLLYIFNVQQLLRKLEKITKNMTISSVRNEGYVTEGFKVPRTLLESLNLTPESIGLFELKRTAKEAK